LGGRKLGGSDIKLFNPCGDQVTHFVDCTESPMLKTPITIVKKRITFDVRPPIFVSLVSKRKYK
jgi:hypothetical protein